MSFASMHNDYLDPDRAGLNDEHPDNEIVKAAFQGEHDSLASLYRAAYKYIDCGPSVGALISYVETVPGDMGDYPQEVERSKWVYCDDLRDLGAWADMDSKGILILSLCVSSIVEGIDATTDTVEVPCAPDTIDEEATADEEPGQTLARLFGAAVEEVDAQAKQHWNDTHGCDSCQTHWQETLYEGREVDGGTPVWEECPQCHGNGTII
jgi:hypothetical protein